VLDGVYRTTEGVPVFHAVRAPTAAELQALLRRIIKRIMKFLTRKGFLIEDGRPTWLTPIGITRWGLNISTAGILTPVIPPTSYSNQVDIFEHGPLEFVYFQ
jgi:hypothetical protein